MKAKNILWGAVGALLLSQLPVAPAGAQERAWEIRGEAGLFAPAGEMLQDVYGTAPWVQGSLATRVGASGKLRFFGAHAQKTGDPFFQIDDFQAPNAGKLSWSHVGIGFEWAPWRTENPIIWLGMGMYYGFGTETLFGRVKNHGSGLGGETSLTAEFPMGAKLAFLAGAVYRVQELAFRSGGDRYRFDMNGGNLLVGFAYKFKTSARR